jgi:hypothetical protein
MSNIEFDLAVKFCCIATELDESKGYIGLPTDILIDWVDKLHAFAQCLAGSRIIEIYAPDDIA